MPGESKTYGSVNRDLQVARLIKALPGFNVVEALTRLNNNFTSYRELLADLCTKLNAAHSALRPLIRGGGIEEALIQLHGLKGISGNLGATDLKQVFENIEKALSASQEKQYEMLITRMEQTIQQNIAAIGAVLHTEAPPQPDPPPPDGASVEHLVETMQLLASLLDQKRLDAVDVFKRLERLMNPQFHHPEFSKLAAAIRHLDYDIARKALTALAASTNIVL